LAQRGRPAEGHGHAHAAGEARGAWPDRVACPAAAGVESDAEPADTAVALGRVAGCSPARPPGPAERAGGEHGCRGAAVVRCSARGVSLSRLPGYRRREPPVHRQRRLRAAGRLLAIRLASLEVSGARSIHRLDPDSAVTAPAPADEQHAVPDPALGSGTAPGELGTGPC